MSLLLKMGQYIKDIYQMKCVMDLVYKFGQTMLSMKVNGGKIRLMVKESFGMLMEIYMKENGRMIKLMDTEYIFM
jgi:hypothetical protein